MTSNDPRQRLTEWFRVLREPLRRYIAGRRGNAHLDSDDVAQEVFLRLLRHTDGESVCDPRAYLFKIASNVADEWSMRARNRLPHESSWLDELVDDANVALDAECGERYSELHNALNDLPIRAREILRLHYSDGLSHEAISMRLGISLRIVRRDSARAYATMRFRLAAPTERTAIGSMELKSAMSNER